MVESEVWWKRCEQTRNFLANSHALTRKWQTLHVEMRLRSSASVSVWDRTIFFLNTNWPSVNHSKIQFKITKSFYILINWNIVIRREMYPITRNFRGTLISRISRFKNLIEGQSSKKKLRFQTKTDTCGQRKRIQGYMDFQNNRSCLYVQ